MFATAVQCCNATGGQSFQSGRAMNDKLDQLSSDLTNLSQAPTERKSYAAITSRKTSKRVFMFDDHILRDIHKVTTADNEPVALHTTSRATPKDLQIAVQWSEVCKDADELTIVCSEVVMGDEEMTQVKRDFSDLITSASEKVSSVLPDTTGAHDDRVEEINNFLKDKCRDTSARFVDNDQNFLFRDGSYDMSAFQNDSVRLSTCEVKRLMSNLSLAASKHREDGAQRGSSSQRGCITPRPTSNRPPKQRRSGPANRPSTQGGRRMLRPTGRRPPRAR